MIDTQTKWIRKVRRNHMDSTTQEWIDRSFVDMTAHLGDVFVVSQQIITLNE